MASKQAGVSAGRSLVRGRDAERRGESWEVKVARARQSRERALKARNGKKRTFASNRASRVDG